MPVLSYPLDAVVERLVTIAGVALVGIATDLAALQRAAPRAVPAVYVLSESTGGAIKYSGPPVQQARSTKLELLVWVRHHGTPAEAVREMQALLAEIDARLAGWTPGDAYGALRFVSSRLGAYDSAHLVTRATYEAAWDFSAPHLP